MRESEKMKKELLAEEETEKPELEKGDIPAMLISGFLTVGIPCAILLFIIIGAVFLLFIH